MPLSPKQLDAAHRLGQDVCVIAGPGSGKTSVLIERFRWLLDDKQISPDRMLTITFTEKAATEIKQRLVTEFESRLNVREQIERAYVSTVHGFCARLLKEHAIDAGVDPEFAVLDNARPLLRRATDDVLEEMYAEDPAGFRVFLRCLAVSTTERGFVPDLASSLMEIYQAMRTAGEEVTEKTLAAPQSRTAFNRVKEICRQMLGEKVTGTETHAKLKQWARDVLDLPEDITEKHFALLLRVTKKPLEFSKNTLRGTVAHSLQDELRTRCDEATSELLPVFYARQREFVVRAMQRIDIAYKEAKRSQSKLDFSDLEERAIELLQKDEALRTRLQDAFDFILMDELQDTNPLQWRLLDLLRKPNSFFGVGDVNQSIFAFRHAEPELFRNYRESLEATGNAIDALRDNYRSREPILSAVNTVFQLITGVEPHTLAGRAEYADVADPVIEVMGAYPAVDDEDRGRVESREALWIANRIAELSSTLRVGKIGAERAATLADFAVLGRTAAVLARIQRALEQVGIPFVVTSSRTFYEKREIRDLKLLLAVLANPYDEVAVAGVLRSPFLSLRDETLLRLKSGPGCLALALKDPPQEIEFEERRRLVALWTEITECRLLRHHVTPDRLLRRLIDFTGFETGLSAQEKANIDKFLSILRDRCVQERPSLSELVEEINAADPEAEAPPAETGNAVRLMTIHGSKGLEFPVVFVASLHQATNVTLPIIRYESGIGLGIRWHNPGDQSANCSDTLHDKIAEKRKAIEEDESNRLLYVAMTRARERLMLSFANVQRGGSWVKTVCRPLGVLLDATADAPTLVNGIRVLLTSADQQVVEYSGARDLTAETLVQLRAPGEQFDSTTSPTAISMYATCPRQYYLARYLRLKNSGGIELAEGEELPDRESGVSAADLGTQVHALLAGAPVPNAAGEAEKLAAVFRSSKLFESAEKATRVEREWEFAFVLEDVIIRGAIDLWFEQDGRITIVDYKTDQLESGKENATKFAAHSLQLRIYALAVERATGNRVDRAYLHYLRSNLIKEVPLEATLFESPETIVRGFRDAHEALEFPLREGTHCRRCEFFRGLCPAGAVRAMAAR